ncbi:MAG: glutamate 5-kinase, partial [Planctomycetota bacterium]
MPPNVADPHPTPDCPIDDVSGVVVKVGTRVLTDANGRLDVHRVQCIANGLAAIAATGRQTVLVSSGAVGAGIGHLWDAGVLDSSQRPSGLAMIQALAAIGQTDLIRCYQNALQKHGRVAAQVLLTAQDLRRRNAYLHVRNTLWKIHELGAIAIVNENDSVSVDELKSTFGDNDSLAANVAGLMPRALLIILSDVDGLYDISDPTQIDAARQSGNRPRVIRRVEKIDESVWSRVRDATGGLSKGGMSSKIRAAESATADGHATIIAPGHDDNALQKILRGESIGTLFLPRQSVRRGRRRWIGSVADVQGHLTLDEGAVRAVKEKDSSLLAIGIRGVEGVFDTGAVVALRDLEGKILARGLTNYPS